jgi:hypothetical protein
MRRGWSPAVYLLIGIGVLAVAIGIDLGRRLFAGPGKPPTAVAPQAPPPFLPDFAVGDPAPDFTLPDRSGARRRLSELVTGDTLLCFTCGCANCLDLQTYIGILRKKMGSAAPDLVSISTMPKDREEGWLKDIGQQHPILYDRWNGPVVTEFRGHPCPRVYRLKPGMKVAWIGPSPKDVPDMRAIGNAVGGNLGFPPQ